MDYIEAWFTRNDIQPDIWPDNNWLECIPMVLFTPFVAMQPILYIGLSFGTCEQSLRIHQYLSVSVASSGEALKVFP